MQLIRSTSVTPDFTRYLYYVKGNDLMGMSKKSKKKSVVAKKVFPMSEKKKDRLYFVSKGPNGKLAVSCAKMKKH